ncbi:hypothetical protein V8E55_010092 [Tylopilus felleus]
MCPRKKQRLVTYTTRPPDTETTVHFAEAVCRGLRHAQAWLGTVADQEGTYMPHGADSPRESGPIGESGLGAFGDTYVCLWQRRDARGCFVVVGDPGGSVGTDKVTRRTCHMATFVRSGDGRASPGAACTRSIQGRRYYQWGIDTVDGIEETKKEISASAVVNAEHVRANGQARIIGGTIRGANREVWKQKDEVRPLGEMNWPMGNSSRPWARPMAKWVEDVKSINGTFLDWTLSAPLYTRRNGEANEDVFTFAVKVGTQWAWVR